MQHISCRFPRLTKSLRSAAGLLLCGLATQAQPTFTNVFPNGAYQFQNSDSLAFTVNSAAGVTNVTVGLTVTSLRGSAYLQTLSVGDGLTVSGPNTGELVTATLTSNTLYSALIQATDANGLSASLSLSFDTIAPSYSWEAEDWDYNGGSYFDNPQTNRYAGLASVDQTDYNNASPGSGNSSYRPQGMETETASDTPRLPYIGTTNVDYDIGYGTTGGFANYTRHYPKGIFNVYARLADGNAAQADTASMSVLSGGAQFLGSGPYTFGVKVTGWQTYQFYPLLDASSNLVQLTNDGSLSTIQLLSDGGSYNANFFILLPANTNVASGGAPTFSGLYPDGTLQFQNTNSFHFTVDSGAGVTPNNVTVQLQGTNLIGQTTVKTYTTANGLLVSGPSTALSVSLPITSNTVYSAFIQAIDTGGNPGTQVLLFDTIVPVYTWEAEDFDHDSGQFVDNPETNAYDSLEGVSNIDCYVDDPTSGGHSYRQGTSGEGPGTETCGDITRDEYTNANAVDIIGNSIVDYDLGWNDSPNWENYTRHYPAGVYNVYLRCSSGGGGGSANLAMVTAGLGTAHQTVQTLGSFIVPNTGSWQGYAFAALKDSNGNLVKVTLSGSGAQTLRFFGPSGCNANFFMLRPADTSLPVFTGVYPNGATLFQQSGTLSFDVASSDGFGASGISVKLNGTDVSGSLVLGGTSTARTVSYSSLQANTVYNVAVNVRTLAGNTSSLNYTFDTYSASNYQWEGSDYDYTSNGVSGLFFDNPQVDRYNGLDAAPGIDQLEVTGGAPLNEDVYRPSPDGSTILVCTQSGGDAARAQFGTNASWRINWFGFGDFCNYTRHYPTGSYNVVGRFTEGGANSSATLLKVTAGYGTATQTTSLLGQFNIPLNGWNAWEYATLVDSSSKPVVVTLDGSRTTLQLAGPVADDGQTINAGFFMLVPVSSAPSGLSVTPSVVAGGNIGLSFSTVTGTSYQVVYKNNLGDATWTPLGSPIAGNNAVQSIQFATTGSQRFYKIQVQ